LKHEVSAGLLITIAVLLLQYGVKLIEQGNLQYGVPLIIVGAAIMVATAILAMPWVRKPFPTIPGYESEGDTVEAKRWLDFKINELLDTGDPVWEYRDELRSIKDICEFVIKEFDYPMRWGTPTDVHRNNWFSGLCCHQITLDYWQCASETLMTLRLNRRYGRKGYGDCEDTSALFVTLMEEKAFEAYMCLGLVYRGEDLLGGHGWAIFKDEIGMWRLYESTLDVPPVYPDGYPTVNRGMWLGLSSTDVNIMSGPTIQRGQ